MTNCVDIFLYNQKSGTLQRTDDGDYIFTYCDDFIKSSAEPISLAMPLRNEPYQSKVLHPFFDGMIPEGWLTEITTRNWKLKDSDRFELLVATCKDAVGAVSVRSTNNDKPSFSIENQSKAAGSGLNILEREKCPITKTKKCMISYKSLSDNLVSENDLYTTKNSKKNVWHQYCAKMFKDCFRNHSNIRLCSD